MLQIHHQPTESAPTTTVGEAINLQSGMTAEKIDWFTRLAQALQKEFDEAEKNPGTHDPQWIYEQLTIVVEMKNLGLTAEDVESFLSGLKGISDIFRQTFIMLCRIKRIQEGIIPRVQRITREKERYYGCHKIDQMLKQLREAKRAEEIRQKEQLRIKV